MNTTVDPFRAVAADAAPPSAPFEAGRVETDELAELSGLAASRQQVGVLWAHNDRDGRLHALAPSGRILATFDLAGVPVGDWEDISVGPATPGGPSFIHIGNTGNEKAEPSTLIRVAEPMLPQSTMRVRGTLDGAETFRIAFPGGERHAEGLMVDPLTGDIFVLAGCDVFEAPRPLVANATNELRKLVCHSLGPARAADIAPGGAGVLVTLPDVVAYWPWRRDAGATLAASLAQPPLRWPALGVGEAEAASFSADGQGFYTAGEAPRQAIYFHPRAGW